MGLPVLYHRDYGESLLGLCRKDDRICFGVEGSGMVGSTIWGLQSFGVGTVGCSTNYIEQEHPSPTGSGSLTFPNPSPNHMGDPMMDPR